VLEEAAGAGAGVAAGVVDSTGGEYKAAKRFFSSSAVSCFGTAPASGAAGIEAGAAGEGTAAGPSGAADDGILVSAMVGVTAGSTLEGGGSAFATAATEAGVAEAGAAGIGAGD